MTEQEIIMLTKILGHILRSKPFKINIIVDSNGWTDVAALLEGVNSFTNADISCEMLNNVVNYGENKRFEFNESKTRIRARHGHMYPVEKMYKEAQPPNILYYSVPINLKNDVMKNGLMPMKRQMIRLSRCYEKVISENESKLYVIDAKKMYEDNYTFCSIKKEVWCTLYVPAKYIKEAEFEVEQGVCKLTYFSFGTPMGILSKANIGYIYTSYVGNEIYYKDYKNVAHISYELWNYNEKSFFNFPFDIREFLSNCKRKDIVEDARIEPCDSDWDRLVKLSKLNFGDSRFYLKPTKDIEEERTYFLKPRK